MRIEPCRKADQPGWLELREALWRGAARREHLVEMAAFVRQPARYGQFIAYSTARIPIGFAEIAVRRDYVNGTRRSPVAFLEGLYVIPEARQRGVAEALVGAATRWARRRGCSELASDAQLDNEMSHAVHVALGFRETERVVFFVKGTGTPAIRRRKISKRKKKGV